MRDDGWVIRTVQWIENAIGSLKLLFKGASKDK